MRKIILSTIALVLISAVFVGCKKETPKYKVQFIATEGGTIEGRSGEYEEGDTINFKAVPNDGYCFVRWSDGKTDNPRFISYVNSDITYEAIFNVLFISSGTIANHNYVDLGLSNGKLWATCNIGADNPWDIGDFFAWGETSPKPIYTLSTYAFYDIIDSTYTKYRGEYQKLESDDDAAKVNWGDAYEMPSESDWVKLSKQCYWEWTSHYNCTDTRGFVVYKAKKEADAGVHAFWGRPDEIVPNYTLSDTHIFIPCLADRQDTYYWMSFSNHFYYKSSTASAMLIGDDGILNSSYERHQGLPVRPVLCKRKEK